MSELENTIKYGEVDSVDFAIYLNKKAYEMNKSANVTKIQKWLYICYGLYFAFHNKQLFTERPKAWDYGPAFPKVHNKQKKNKNSLNGLESKTPFDLMAKYDDIIEATLRVFGDWSASELVEWTHVKGKAWHKTIILEGEKSYAPLDNHDIFCDFKGLISGG